MSSSDETREAIALAEELLGGRRAGPESAIASHEALEDAVYRVLTRAAATLTQEETELLLMLGTGLYALRMSDLGRAILRLASRRSPERSESATGENLIGILEARSGHFPAAVTALGAAERTVHVSDSVSFASVQANRATVELSQGRNDQAVAWIDRARRSLPGEADGAHVELVASTIQLSMAQGLEDRRDVSQELAALESATRRAVHYYGSRHPLSLSALANLTVARGTSACARQDWAAARKAIEVLDACAIQLGAMVGASDSQAVVARANTSVLEFSLARAQGPIARVEETLKLLERATWDTVDTLSSGHRHSTVMAVNLYVARLELSRIRQLDKDREASTNALVIAARDLARTCGAEHPSALIALVNAATAQFELASVRPTSELLRSAEQSLVDVSLLATRRLGVDHPIVERLSRKLQICSDIRADEERRGFGNVLVVVKAPPRHHWDDEPSGVQRVPDVLESQLYDDVLYAEEVDQLSIDPWLYRRVRAFFERIMTTGGVIEGRVVAELPHGLLIRIGSAVCFLPLDEEVTENDNGFENAIAWLNVRAMSDRTRRITLRRVAWRFLPR